MCKHTHLHTLSLPLSLSPSISLSLSHSHTHTSPFPRNFYLFLSCHRGNRTVWEPLLHLSFSFTHTLTLSRKYACIHDTAKCQGVSVDHCVSLLSTPPHPRNTNDSHQRVSCQPPVMEIPQSSHGCPRWVEPWSHDLMEADTSLHSKGEL